MRLVRGLVVLVLLLVAVAAIGLTWMHLQIQRERAPLPLVGDVIDLAKVSDLPTKVSVIETARQAMPRGGVLDPGSDPNPTAPFVMTHPAFVVEWSDGRLLLIDTGMSRLKASEFGSLLERFGGASPVEPLRTVTDALGADASRVKGIVFTHLHIDHVDGLRELCPRLGPRTKLFMTAPQLDAWTLLTAEGKGIVTEATCVDRVRLGGGALLSLDGFPGVAIIGAGGHTPGSQIIAVTTRDASGAIRRFLFSGDITNTIDGIRGDLSKPFFYRLVIVPEDDDRLGELRRYLRVLEKDHGFIVVPSHDGLHLKSLDLPAWGK